MSRSDNSNYSRAKVLTLIPVIVLAVTVICMIIAMMLEAPTGKGVIYSFFAFIGLMGMFLSPLPCLVVSAIGTLFAVKAVREGAAAARMFCVLGFMEIFVCITGLILVIMMFTVVQGV